MLVNSDLPRLFQPAARSGWQRPNICGRFQPIQVAGSGLLGSRRRPTADDNRIVHGHFRKPIRPLKVAFCINEPTDYFKSPLRQRRGVDGIDGER